MKVRLIAYIAAAFICVALVSAASAQGSWPMFRCDEERTGRTADASLASAEPWPIWVFPAPVTEIKPVDDYLATRVGDDDEPNFACSSSNWENPVVDKAMNGFNGDYLRVSGSSSGTEWATWTFTMEAGLAPSKFYVYVWFPSSGVGKPHTSAAHYSIAINAVTVDTVVMDQMSGGTWLPLGGGPYVLGGGDVLQVGLTNLGDDDEDAWVVADAVKLEQDTGKVFSSPAASPTEPIVVSCVTETRLVQTIIDTVEIPDPIDPTDPTKTTTSREVVQSGTRSVGVIYGIGMEIDSGNLDPGVGDDRGFAVWQFPDNPDNWIGEGFSSSPAIAEIGGEEVAVIPGIDGQVYVIRTGPAVLPANRLVWQGPGYIVDGADIGTSGGWVAATHSGYQGAGYLHVEAANTVGGTATATWSFGALGEAGDYAVYAWIPPSTDLERYVADARYSIEIGGTEIKLTIDQVRNGGGWVQLGGTHRVDVGEQVTLTLTNETRWTDPDPTKKRYVAADAIRVVPDDLRSFEFSSPVVAGDGTIYVGNTRGRVYALKVGDPDPVWTYPDPEDLDSSKRNRLGAVYASPALDGGKLYVGSADGHVYALDAGDGSEDWVYPSKDPASGTLQVLGEISSTTAVGDYIYVGIGGGGRSIGFDYEVSGRVIALDKSGKLQWMYPADTTRDSKGKGAFLYSSPLLIDIMGAKTVVIGSTDGYLYALDAITGAEMWTVPGVDLGQGIGSSAAGVMIPAIGPIGYVATDGGRIWGVNLNTRVKEWSWSLFGAAVSSPAIYDNRIYIGDEAGFTWAFSTRGAGSGAEELWNTEIAPEAPGPGAGAVTATPEINVFRWSEYNLFDPTESEQDAGTIDASIADGDLHKIARAMRETLPPGDPLAYEWGETVHLIAWNLQEPADPVTTKKNETRVTVTFKSRAPGDQADQVNSFQMSDRGRFLKSDGTYVYYVRYPLVLDSSSSGKTQSPGTRITIAVAESGGKVQEGSSVVPVLDSTGTPRVDPKTNEYEPQIFAINNPLGLAYDGWQPSDNIGVYADMAGMTTESNAPYAAFNGNPRRWVWAGMTAHGTSSEPRLPVVCDRSKLVEINQKMDKFRAERYDMAWTGGPNQVVNLIPEMEQQPPIVGPNGSSDYPDIAARRLSCTMADSGIDPTSESVELRLAPRSDLPRRPVGPNPVSTVVTVPRFQPANVGQAGSDGSGYITRVYVYVDSNKNGRLEKPAALGVSRYTGRSVSGGSAEAYREFLVQVHVPADFRVEVAEKLIDIGKVPHGFGLTSGQSGVPALFCDKLSDCLSPAASSPPGFDEWFKRFTAYNLGNVNLLNVRMYRWPLVSDTVEAHAIPATNIVSALDTVFEDDVPPRVLNPLPSYLGQPVSNYCRLFLKARVGGSPPVLQMPTGQQDKRPSFSIAVPLGQPVGTYHQKLTLVETSNGLIWVGNPIIEAKITVVEGRLTDGFTPGALPQLDDTDPNALNARPTGDMTPAAYRDPTTGNAYLFWASSRFGDATRGTAALNPIPSDPWYLYMSRLPWFQESPNPGRWAFAETDPAQWWARTDPTKAFPDPTKVDLFFPAPPKGADGSMLQASVRFTNPSIAEDNFQGRHRAWLFFNGTVYKHEATSDRKVQESRNFYTEITGGDVSKPILGSDDWTMPKYGVRGVAARVQGWGDVNEPSLWTFWYGGNNNKWRIYYSTTPDPDDPRAWVNDVPLAVPVSLSSTAEPAAVFRPNANVVGSNEQIVKTDVFDVVYSGFSTFHKNSDIYLSRYKAYDPDNRRVSMSLVIPPPVEDEVLTKDPKTAVWYSRHVDWDTADPMVKVRVGADEWQVNSGEFTRDSVTGSLIYDYNDQSDPVQRELRAKFRATVIDPKAGTVKFMRAPPKEGRVEATYRPRAYRLTTDSSSDVSPFALLDGDPNPRYQRGVQSNPFVMPQGWDDRVPPPIDRLWVLWRRPAPATKGTGLFYKSFRYTVRLEMGQIALDPTGKPLIGLDGPIEAPVEVDWVKNRLYFTGADEGKQVSVKYTTVDGSQLTESHRVVLQEELDAQGNAFGHLTDQIVNEGQIYAFKDSREQKLWAFWASSRSGNTDIYYEAIAPRFYGIEYK